MPTSIKFLLFIIAILLVVIAVNILSSHSATDSSTKRKIAALPSTTVPVPQEQKATDQTARQTELDSRTKLRIAAVEPLLASITHENPGGNKHAGERYSSWGESCRQVEKALGPADERIQLKSPPKGEEVLTGEKRLLGLEGSYVLSYEFSRNLPIPLSPIRMVRFECWKNNELDDILIIHRRAEGEIIEEFDHGGWSYGQPRAFLLWFHVRGSENSLKPSRTRPSCAPFPSLTSLCGRPSPSRVFASLR